MKLDKTHPLWIATLNGLLCIGAMSLIQTETYAVQNDTEDPATGVLESITQIDFEDSKLGELPDSWKLKGMEKFTASVSDQDAKSGKQLLLVKSDVEGAGGQPVGAVNLFTDVEKIRGKRIRFRASTRGSFNDEGQAMLWLREDLKSGEYGAFDNMMDRPIKTGDWGEHAIVADISNDAKTVVVGILFAGTGELLVDDVVIEVVDESVASTVKSQSTNPLGSKAAPGLFEINGAMEVQSFGGNAAAEDKDVRVLLPLPLRNRSQYPVTYNLTTEPVEALKSFRVFEDKANNFVAELTLQDVRKHKKVSVNFNSAVLVLPSDFSDVPDSAEVPVDWPESVQPWLQATWCVDSENERIQQIAREIRAETNDVLEIFQQVEVKSKDIFQSAKGFVQNLTAVEALDSKGSCTSNGNLVAALLRASDIPARVVAGYPSWSGPLQTHYIVEAYIPNYGWYPIESTFCKSPWPNHNQINVAIIPPEYESEKLAGMRTGVAGGVPFLSLTEIPENDGSYLAFGTLPDKPGCDHECQFIRKFENSAASWSSAAEWAEPRWNEWLGSKHEIENGRIAFGPMSTAIHADSAEGLVKELAK